MWLGQTRCELARRLPNATTAGMWAPFHRAQQIVVSNWATQNSSGWCSALGETMMLSSRMMWTPDRCASWSHQCLSIAAMQQQTAHTIGTHTNFRSASLSVVLMTRPAPSARTSAGRLRTTPSVVRIFAGSPGATPLLNRKDTETAILLGCARIAGMRHLLNAQRFVGQIPRC